MQQALKGRLVTLASQVLLPQRVPQVQVMDSELRVSLEFQDQMGKLAQLAQLELKDRQVQPEQQAQME